MEPKPYYQTVIARPMTSDAVALLIVVNPESGQGRTPRRRHSEERHQKTDHCMTYARTEEVHVLEINERSGVYDRPDDKKERSD